MSTALHTWGRERCERGWRLLRLMVLMAVAAGVLGACALREGLGGKDAIWISTPDALVREMLLMAEVTPQDLLVDLGSGDGRFIIAAARDFGTPGLGLEYNQQLVDLSVRLAAEAGVSDLARFERADIFVADFSDATVVAMYLLPNLTLKLRHTLMAMRPGTRIVAHQYGLGAWQPDRSVLIEGRSGMLWVVPVNAGGAWRIQVDGPSGPRSGEARITQRFQMLTGELSLDGQRAALVDGRVRGHEVDFSYRLPDGSVHRFEGVLGDGGQLAGSLVTAAARLPFRAARTAPAPEIEGSRPVNQVELDMVRLDN